MERLFDLLTCHSTPGDEGEAAALLLHNWRRAGWRTRSHATYAISATRGDHDPASPTVLVCAHMDSPGYAVECRRDDQLALIALGGVRFSGVRAPGRIKTSKGIEDVDICMSVGDDGPVFQIDDPGDANAGDRVCFKANPRLDDSGCVHSPFLDNRLGCYALLKLAECPCPDGVNLVLGATACEEMGGFGAPVLARAVLPDAVICLDATYEAKDQDVVIGNGPVLTLSDNSVIVSPCVRDRVAELLREHGLPLQTEVYNYSGTDARAFPHLGLPAPVYSLLIATRGNHTPEEICSADDIRSWIKCLATLVTHGSAAGLFHPRFE